MRNIEHCSIVTDTKRHIHARDRLAREVLSDEIEFVHSLILCRKDAKKFHENGGKRTHRKSVSSSNSDLDFSSRLCVSAANNPSLGRLATDFGGAQFSGDFVEDGVDVLVAMFGAEGFGQLHCLVDDRLVGNIQLKLKLECADA